MDLGKNFLRLVAQSYIPYTGVTAQMKNTNLDND